jgi:hypothetical protein
LGRDSGELATTRVDYDDVDDYHGWSATPPTAKDGTTLRNSAGWTQGVVVRWVDPSQPEQVVGAESGAKRIIVTISYNGVPQASLVAVRTAHE